MGGQEHRAGSGNAAGGITCCIAPSCNRAQRRYASCQLFYRLEDRSSDSASPAWRRADFLANCTYQSALARAALELGGVRLQLKTATLRPRRAAHTETRQRFTPQVIGWKSAALSVWRKSSRRTSQGRSPAPGEPTAFIEPGCCRCRRRRLIGAKDIGGCRDRQQWSLLSIGHVRRTSPVWRMINMPLMGMGRFLRCPPPTFL